MRIAILGAGAWGSALATCFSQSGHDLVLWSRNAADCAALARDRTSRYLPGVALPAPVRVEAELARALEDREVIVVATATAGLRETARAVRAVVQAPSLLGAC